MLAHEIVVREVQRDSRAQFFNLLGKAVGQPRKPAHLHTHGQVLPRLGTEIPFPIMRGNLPEAWILSYTERPTKKIHGDRAPSGRPIDFGSTPGKSDAASTPAFRWRTIFRGKAVIRVQNRRGRIFVMEESR